MQLTMTTSYRTILLLCFSCFAFAQETLIGGASSNLQDALSDTNIGVRAFAAKRNVLAFLISDLRSTVNNLRLVISNPTLSTVSSYQITSIGLVNKLLIDDSGNIACLVFGKSINDRTLVRFDAQAKIISEQPLTTSGVTSLFFLNNMLFSLDSSGKATSLDGDKSMQLAAVPTPSVVESSSNAVYIIDPIAASIRTMDTASGEQSNRELDSQDIVSAKKQYALTNKKNSTGVSIYMSAVSTDPDRPLILAITPFLNQEGVRLAQVDAVGTIVRSLRARIQQVDGRWMVPHKMAVDGNTLYTVTTEGVVTPYAI